ncbi:MAG TPA: PAS domain S-box protein [Spirochaetes bacterium]|nr:PAS domain S-box protein [Spirochaetota bacterium]
MMQKSVESVLFIGQELETLAGSASGSFDVQVLEKHVQVFDFFRADQKKLQTFVVFFHFKTMKSLARFVQKAEKELPLLFMFTPLVACFTGKVPDELDPSIRKFDFVMFRLPGRESIGNIIKFAIIRKYGIRKNYNRSLMDREINISLMEKIRKKINKDKKTEYDFLDLYYGVDENGIFNTVGDEVLRVLGFSREEIIGHHFSEIIAAEELEGVKKAFTEKRTGERALKESVVKFRTKNKGSEEFVIDAHGVHIPSIRDNPDKDPDRVYIGTLGEARLKGSFEEPVNVFENSLEPMIIYSLSDGGIITNKGFELFTGYSNEDLYDKKPDYFERPDKSYFFEYLDRIRTEKHCTYNTVIVTKSGDECFSEASLDFAEIGEKSYVIAIYRDISDIIRMIEEVETLIKMSWDIGNTARTEDLIENAAEKMKSILKVQFLAVALLKNSKKTVYRYFIKGDKKGEWFDPADLQFHTKIKDVLHEAVKEKKTVYREVGKIFGSEGVEFIGDLYKDGVVVISPLIINARVFGCIIVIHKNESMFTLQGIRLLELSSNIIAAGIRKLRLERELRKNLEELEVRVKERTKELEDFVHTVSHDLKSPLHAAHCFADMIKEQFEKYIKSDEDEYMIRRISENISQSLSMIDDLLKLSRIGTQELMREEVDISEIVKDYAVQFNTLKDGDIKLDIDISEEFPHLFVDGGRIIQLFTNIFNNSIKYRKTKNVKIVISNDIVDGKIRISIKDNGKGIKEEDLPKVFNIFYRGIPSGKTPDEEGSGVGLTIVKKIAEQHGGSIDIKSGPGIGTEVIIELPHYRG